METDFSSDCSESFINNGKTLCEAQIVVRLSRVRPTRTARNDQVKATGKPVCTGRLKCPCLSSNLPLQLQVTRQESLSILDHLLVAHWSTIVVHTKEKTI